MGIFDFLFGRKQEQPQRHYGPVSFGEGPVRLGGTGLDGSQAPTTDPNEQALQRYRYLLRTAPPETIEQAHAEAFARMTPEERAYVLRALAAELPPAERAELERRPDDAQVLARAATRAEMRNPGTLERTLGSQPAHGAGGGMLSGMAGTLLMSVAAGFVGSMAASAFLNAMAEPMVDPGFEPDLAEADFGGFDGGFDEF